MIDWSSFAARGAGLHPFPVPPRDLSLIRAVPNGTSAIPFPTRVLELDSDAMVPRKVYNELLHCRVTLQAIADELHEADRAPLWDVGDRNAAKVRAFDAIASLLSVVGMHTPPQADGDTLPLEFDEDPRDPEDAERVADERLSAMEDAGNRWAEDESDAYGRFG